MIITISGKAGSGKSSVSKALAARLGYKTYSAGGVRREYALKHGMTLEELNNRAKTDPASDFLVDDYMKELAAKEDNLVVEGRLAFFCIPESIKIFLNANDLIRAKRTAEPGRLQESAKDLDDAARKLKERDEGDVKRYLKLYNVDPYDHKHFDLVIDTSNNTTEQTTNMIYKFVMKRMKQKKK